MKLTLPFNLLAFKVKGTHASSTAQRAHYRFTKCSSKKKYLSVCRLQLRLSHVKNIVLMLKNILALTSYVQTRLRANRSYVQTRRTCKHVVPAITPYVLARRTFKLASNFYWENIIVDVIFSRRKLIAILLNRQRTFAQQTQLKLFIAMETFLFVLFWQLFICLS